MKNNFKDALHVKRNESIASIDNDSFADDAVLRKSKNWLGLSCFIVDTTLRRLNPHIIACWRDIFHLFCSFRRADFRRWLSKSW